MSTTAPAIFLPLTNLLTLPATNTTVTNLLTQPALPFKALTRIYRSKGTIINLCHTPNLNISAECCTIANHAPQCPCWVLHKFKGVSFQVQVVQVDAKYFGWTQRPRCWHIRGSNRHSTLWHRHGENVALSITTTSWKYVLIRHGIPPLKLKLNTVFESPAIVARMLLPQSKQRAESMC